MIALGSNIEPRKNLPRALAALREHLEVTAVSRLWETEPVGRPAAPAFLNAAVRVETRLGPVELKWEVLRPLEAELGRVRTEDKNAPRVIDLDLVLYGSLVLEDPQRGLSLPDPDLSRLAHLALPVAEVAGDLRHPETHERLARLAERFGGEEGVRVVGEEIPGWGPSPGTSAPRPA